MEISDDDKHAGDLQPRQVFGEELKRLRALAGISQSELARSTNLSRSQLCKIEAGSATPNTEFIRLCEERLEAQGQLKPLLSSNPLTRAQPFRRLNLLPAAVIHFVGRAAETSHVKAALGIPGSVCAVSGMAGAGKTALAIRTAHEIEADYADGCLYLDIADVARTVTARTPSDAAVEEAVTAAVLDRALRLLGIPDDRIPTSLAGRIARYRDRLYGRSVLIVLDNAISARQVESLRPTEPRCSVLATSRVRLAALDEATHVALPMLDDTAASDLFHAVAGLLGPQTEEAAAVNDIIGFCAGLPLAVRIAAARLRSNDTWKPETLRRRLMETASRLTEFDDGERSVSAVLTMSLDDLSPHAVRAFLLLGCLPGPDFDAATASVLFGITIEDADTALAELHRRHLVECLPGERFRLHDLLRELATKLGGERLDRDERGSAFRRVLEAMFSTAARADLLLYPQRYRPDSVLADLAPPLAELNDAAGVRHWFVSEWRNLVALCVAAEQLGADARCWQLAFVLRSHFFETKQFDSWIVTHRCAADAARRAGDPMALAMTLTNLGTALFDQGDLDNAASTYKEAEAIFRMQRDPQGVTTVVANRGWIAIYREDYEAALRDLRRAVGRYLRQGNIRNVAISRRGISLALTALGRTEEAAETARNAQVLADDLGLALDAAMAGNCLGWAQYQRNDLEAADRSYRDARRRALACGSDYEAARASVGCGNVAAARHENVEAADWWAMADRLRPDLDPLMAPEAGARSSGRGTAGNQPKSAG